MRNYIISSWKNIFFPTSYILTNNLDIDKPSMSTINKFKKLDSIIYKFVKNIHSKYQLVIITNKNTNWINFCMKLLPKTSLLYYNNVIYIISSSDLYSNIFPKEYWKYKTIELCVNKIICEGSNGFILTIGTSLKNYNILDDTKIYNLDLKKDPTLDEMLDQLTNIENILKNY